MADVITPIPQDKKGEGEGLVQRDIMYDGKTERQKFRLQNIEQQQKATKEHKPYCYKCAKTDHEKEQQRLFEKSGKRAGKSIEDVKVDFDFNPYVQKSRFDLVKEDDVMQDKLIDSMRVNVKTGKWQEYKCKERGCKISVEVPSESKK